MLIIGMNFHMDKIEETYSNLTASKSTLRRVAAKLIGKNKITELGKPLWGAYQNEIKNPKAWEIQVEIIKSLGLIGFKESKEAFYKICKENKEHDMVTSSATKAYIRIARTNIQDVNPILDLLSFGKFEVVSSAFEVLGEDKMMPSLKEIIFFLDYVSKSAIVNEKGYTDFRIGLVCACAGWKGIPEVSVFLNECVKEEESFFVKVAINALKGKYTAIS